MKTIPTAEETLRQILGNCNWDFDELKECEPELIQECIDIIKNQNKLHVEAALKAADIKAENEIPEGFWEDIDDKNFIINSYPLTNIK
jgi:hypothetical protein